MGEAPTEGKWICLAWPVNYHPKPSAEWLFIFSRRDRKTDETKRTLDEINKGGKSTDWCYSHAGPCYVRSVGVAMAYDRGQVIPQIQLSGRMNTLQSWMQQAKAKQKKYTKLWDMLHICKWSKSASGLHSLLFVQYKKRNFVCWVKIKDEIKSARANNYCMEGMLWITGHAVCPCACANQLPTFYYKAENTHL